MKPKYIVIIIVSILSLALVLGVVLKNNDDSGTTDILAGDTNTPPSHIDKVPDGYIGIYTPEDLQNVSKNMNANYILMNDLDLSGFELVPYVGSYTGTFNGNKYTIRNFNSHTPVFPYISDATIKNLFFENATINRLKDYDGITFSGNETVGGIVGQVAFGSGVCVIENCKYSGSIIIPAGSEQDDNNHSKVGGIIGLLRGDDSYVIGCTFDGKIEVVGGYIKDMGGIAGAAFEESSKIQNCFSTGRIMSDNKAGSVGGICGSVYMVNIYDCYSSIDISVNDCNDVGGIIGGSSESDVRFAYYKGNIEYRALYTGLPTGWDEREEDTDREAGAVVGYVDRESTVQYCYFLENTYPAVGNGTPFANVSALSKEDMLKQTSYYGFDFDFTWGMGNKDYPYPILLNNY